MNKKLSIIVAIYNIENYLVRCLKSLINQKLDDKIEILLINDGSTDKSLEICKNYIDKGLKARIINKANGGLTSVRNLGIKEAEGEYLLFIDGDDWLEDNTVEIILKELDDFDMLAFGFNWVYKDKIQVDKRFLNSKILKKGLVETIFKDEMNTSIWNKALKREIIIKNNLEFPELNGAEDYLFVYDYLDKCEKIKIIDVPLYNYLQRESSLSNIKKSSYYINTLHVYLGFIERIQKNNKNSKDAFKYILESYVYLMRDYIKNGDKKDSQTIEKLRKKVEEYLKIKKVILNKSIKLKVKMRYIKIRRNRFEN